MMLKLPGSIRLLKADEFEECAAIWNLAQNPELAIRWKRDIENGVRSTFVYEEDGVLLGEISLARRHEDPDYTIEGKRAYLSHLVVAAAHRKRGIGKALTEALCTYAKEQGFAELSLGVDLDNTTARRLYERHGFTTILKEDEDAGGKYLKLLRIL